MKTFFKNNWKIILICGLIVLVAGLGSVFVNLGMDWFDSLDKPAEWIPSFVIPVVWSVIYLAFAVILSVSVKNNLITKRSIWLSALNGFFNLLWCFVFFTLNQLFIGNIIIIVNAFIGVLLVLEIVKTSKWYFKILWIYPVWLFIATSLNTALWILN